MSPRAEINASARPRTVADSASSDGNSTGPADIETGVFQRAASHVSGAVSDQTVVNYSNADLDVVMLVERKGEKYEKGSYPIEVYVEGKLVGSASLELSDSFLGL